MIKLSKTQQDYLEKSTIQENLTANAAAQDFLNSTGFSRNTQYETDLIDSACAQISGAVQQNIDATTKTLDNLTVKRNKENDSDKKTKLEDQIRHYQNLAHALRNIADQVRQITESTATISCTQALAQLNRLALQTEAEEKLTKHRTQESLHTVEQALDEAMAQVGNEQAPQEIEALPQAQDIQAPQPVLHASRAKTLSNQGQDVLEFQMAGSGFKEFRKEKQGLHGDGTAVVANQKIKVTEKDESMLKASWYNKSRLFNWLPGVKTSARIEEENKKRQQRNLLREIARQKVNETFGTTQEIGGQTLNHVRRKGNVEGQRAKVSIAGALGVNGMLNVGDYSIENSRQYMLAMASSYIQHKFADYLAGRQQLSDLRPITVTVRGHSRGAVSSFDGVQLTKEWLQRTYGSTPEGRELIDKVSFEVLQYDPVPGFGSYDDHSTADYSRLGAKVNSTVVYSLHTERNSFFTPQQVSGVKRLILSPSRHGVGLDQIDTSQVEQMHSQTMTDAQGNKYRGAGIGELPEGVYILDESNRLHRLENQELAGHTIDNVLKNAGSGQDGRTEVIKNAVASWFTTHAPA